jgi:upstream activation factor subunit UAF30
MPKKSSAVKSEQSIVVDASTVNASTVNAVVEKKPRKTKADKVEVASTSNSIVVAPLVESDVSAAPAVETENETPLADQSLEFLAKLQQISIAISTLKSEYRALEKKWTRELKVVQRQNNRKKRNGKNRAPSGFVKPTKISDELASFLGKDKGSEMARTDVTREINSYIRTNKLQDKDNGRKIIPDKKLAALLKLKTTDELTYFNLQKYMSPHFAKAVKVEVSV